jgi:hypothetical protein
MIFVLAVFIVLLVMGVLSYDLTWFQAGAYVLIAAASLLAIVLLEWPFISFFAVLSVIDIVLVFAVLKGDIRIS